jgi:BMFP domain-containing protein YqiC
MLAIVCGMIDPKLIDELSEHLSASLPGGIRTLQADLSKSFRASLEAGLAKLDLVTREEFDVQRAVLARTREKLNRLEQRVKALEAQLDKPSG